jgi:hypothetical protein
MPLRQDKKAFLDDKKRYCIKLVQDKYWTF